MPLNSVETKIRNLVTPNVTSPRLTPSLGKGPEATRLYIIKYLQPKHLATTLSTSMLHASNTPGYSWGDAIYVAPLAFPRTTMMYGSVAVVGWVDSTTLRCFDSTQAGAIDLYQEWIAYFPSLFNQLTTTVHADHANRELRNKFRTRFGIDCVIFPPDEPCMNYADPATDVWLALTHWNSGRQVGYGLSALVQGLRWCGIGTDAFEKDGLGYRSLVHPLVVPGSTNFVRGAYPTLSTSFERAYAAGQVVITEF